jgi:hypothetical protein
MKYDKFLRIFLDSGEGKGSRDRLTSDCRRLYAHLNNPSRSTKEQIRNLRLAYDLGRNVGREDFVPAIEGLSQRPASVREALRTAQVEFEQKADESPFV